MPPRQRRVSSRSKCVGEKAASVIAECCKAEQRTGDGVNGCNAQRSGCECGSAVGVVDCYMRCVFGMFAVADICLRYVVRVFALLG